MVEFIVGLGIGLAVGVVFVVIASKNNKNTIASARETILTKVADGKDAVEAAWNKHFG